MEAFLMNKNGLISAVGSTILTLIAVFLIVGAKGSFYHIILGFGFIGSAIGLVFALNRHYFNQYLSQSPPAILQQNDPHLRLAQAIELKKSPRLADKAKTQQLLKQIIQEDILPPDLVIYGMLNLCELLLDEVRAYGELEAFREADELSNQIYDIALEQGSTSLLVDALLFRSKFALLNGTVAEADRLLREALAVAEEKGLARLTEKVLREKESLEKEVVRWEDLITRAAPLRERLEHARLQDYIADAVRIIKLEETTD
jgi:hypothetical protein